MNYFDRLVKRRALETTWEVWVDHPGDMAPTRMRTFRDNSDTSGETIANGYVLSLPDALRPMATIIKVTREMVG